MSRKSDNGLGLLITVIIFVVSLPVLLISWIVKATSKNTNKLNSNTGTQYPIHVTTNGNSNVVVSDNRIYPNKTKQDIKDESKLKFDAISENKKEYYLKKRKNFLKILNISLGSISASFVLCGIFALIGGMNILDSLIIIIIFTVLSLIFFVYMTIKLKQPSQKLILEQIKKEVRKNYNSLTKDKVKKETNKVKQHSELFKSILKLNEQYSFNRNICKKHVYYETCNSKRALDNYNFEKYIINKIIYELAFFEQFKVEYESNRIKYLEYAEKYKNLEKYTTIRDLENFDLDYETYHYIEGLLFRTSKKDSIEKPSVQIKINYTSPTGRNSYDDNIIYSLDEIVKFIEIAKKPEETKIRKPSSYNIEKQMERLAKEKEKLEKDRQEFLEATKEHIYTTATIEVKDEEIEIDESLSLTQKLKLLRNKLDNGEITFEEYQAKRKELM